MTTTPDDPHQEEEDSNPDSPSDAKPDAQREEFNVWDAIVADLTGQLDTGGLDTNDPVPPKSDPMIDELLSEGTFEPPEPPPLGVPADMITRLGWGGVLGGPIIVFTSSVIGIGSTGVGIGLLAFASGFAVLIIKMKDRDPQDDDGDGAVV
jgi:hypothetical protein